MPRARRRGTRAGRRRPPRTSPPSARSRRARRTCGARSRRPARGRGRGRGGRCRRGPGARLTRYLGGAPETLEGGGWVGVFGGGGEWGGGGGGGGGGGAVAGRGG